MEVTHAEQSAIMTSLPPSERAALALNSSQTERDLRELAVKHANIQVIKDKAGRDQAHGAAMEVKRARTAVERIGKEARDDATKFSKAVIAEQNRLVDIIVHEEQRLLALRDAWDTEQEKIKEAAAAAERYRVEQIIGRIEAIRGFQRMAMDCRTSAAVQRLQEGLAKVDLTGMDEFEAQAERAYAEAVNTLDQIRAQREADEADRARIKAAQEAEAARIAAERAELERLRTEAAARAQAEAEKLAKERAALEAARIEFEQRQKAHEARERAEREAKEAAEREQFEAEQRAAEAALSAAIALDAKPVLIDEDGDVPLISDTSATPEFIEPVPAQEEVQVPDAIDLILTIAEQYGIDKVTARDWLIQRAGDIEATEF